MSLSPAHGPAADNTLRKADCPAIGILVPTYNRVDALLECLRHLERQTEQDFEVVVVDDGSSDATAAEVARYQAHSPLRLRYLSQANSGPATARNLGLRALSAPVCVMIGDDIFPEPGFVAAHLDFHRQHPEPATAAIGLTRWSTRGQTLTPYMHWLEQDNSIQFAYADLLAGTPATWKHFYTSNLSVKTAHLLENPFHEGFPRAALEDIELGYRLHRKGALDLHFLPGAVADHLHPTDFAGSCRRMGHVGQAGFLLGQLWPDFRRVPPRAAWKRLPLALLMRRPWLLRLLTRLTVPVTRMVCWGPWLHTLLMLHERAGYEAAERAAQQAAAHAAEYGQQTSLAPSPRVR